METPQEELGMGGRSEGPAFAHSEPSTVRQKPNASHTRSFSAHMIREKDTGKNANVLFKRKEPKSYHPRT